MAVEQPQPDRHRDERDGDAREQLEDERGQERELEGRHRRAPVALGDRSDRLDLRLRAAEDLQRREPAHDVEEMARQHLERAQLPILPTLHPHPDQRHEDRDERDGDRDDDGGDPVGGAHRDDHGDRHDHREHELRQVPREVAVERVDPMGRERREVPVGIGARPLARRRRASRRGRRGVRTSPCSTPGSPTPPSTTRRPPGAPRRPAARSADRGRRATSTPSSNDRSDHRREQPRLCDDEQRQ